MAGRKRDGWTNESPHNRRDRSVIGVTDSSRYNAGYRRGSTAFSDEDKREAQSCTEEALRTSQKLFNWKLLISCLVGGIIALLIDQGLYSVLYRNIPNPLLFGMLMAIFAFCIFAAVITVSERYSVPPRRTMLFALIAALVLFISGVLFQFIYQLDFSLPQNVPQNVSITDYIFCIDDSGSMSGNDPENLRYSALESILNQLDDSSNVGVIRFTGHVFAKCRPSALNDEQKIAIRELCAKEKGLFAGGGTNFTRPLNKAFKMYNNLGISGRNQVVVLLSDGECSLDVSDMSAQYNEAGIMVCSIFLGQSEEMPAVLEEIAESTGGKAFGAENADELLDTFNEIVESTNKKGNNSGSYVRFLWSERNASDEKNLLAMIERILFFALLGLLIGILFYGSFGAPLKQQVLFSLVEGLACGVLLEFGYRAGLSTLMRIVTILMALIFAMFKKYEAHTTIPADTRQKSTNGIRPKSSHDIGRGDRCSPEGARNLSGKKRSNNRDRRAERLNKR